VFLVFLAHSQFVFEDGSELELSMDQLVSGAWLERGLARQLVKQGKGLAVSLLRLGKWAKEAINVRQAPVSHCRLAANDGIVAFLLQKPLIELQCVLQQLPAHGLHLWH